MDFDKSKIHISIKNTEYSFSYLYKKDTTFQELFEYIAFHLPSLNICQCYNFQAAEHKNNFDDQCILITKNCKIVDYSNYLKKLRLFNNNHNNCLHSNKNYLLYSKQEIISYFEKKITPLRQLMSGIILEKRVEDYPCMISLKNSKNIISQMENGVCKINVGHGKSGTGFFTKMKFNENEIIQLLVTNDHVLGEDFIKNERSILFPFLTIIPYLIYKFLSLLGKDKYLKY